MKKKCLNCSVEIEFKVKDIMEVEEDMILDADGELCGIINGCKANSHVGDKDVKGISREIECPACIEINVLSRRRI